MKSPDAFQFFQLFDGLHADPYPFFRLFFLGHTGQAFYHLIGDIHARDFILHVFGHAGRLHGSNPCQDTDLFMKAAIPDALHPLFEFLNIVDALGLNKIRPCLGLFGEAGDPQLKGIGKGICGSADEHLGRIQNVITPLKFSLVTHGPDHLHKLDGIDIIDVGRHGVIAKARMIAGKTEHGIDAVGISTQDVALHGQTVAVSRDHLQNGMETHLLQDDAGRKTGHSHHGRLVVRHIDCVNGTPEQFSLFLHLFRHCTPRRSTFGCNRQLSRCQNLF